MVPPPKPQKRLSLAEQAQIAVLREEGHTFRSIADRFGVTAAAILKQSRKIDQGLPPGLQPGRGRKRKTSAREDALIVSEVNRNRFAVAADILKELPQLTVSNRTLRRRIADLSVAREKRD